MYKPLLIVFLLFTNCKSTSTISRANGIPASFLGNFKDDYGIRYTINDSAWIQHPNIKYRLMKYDSKGQYLIAQNAAGNPSEAGLYTRIDIMSFSNMEPWTWGFCLTEYKAKTAKEAEAKESADRANPKKGCGGYPFSRMKKEAR